MTAIFARKASRFSIAIVAAAILAGCTTLISEKPAFAAADYDTSGALYGHYRSADGKQQVLVTRGAAGQFVVQQFDVAVMFVKGKDGNPDEQHESLTQSAYAEGAAIPLGGGDFALQMSCVALAHDGKTFASWLGGKASPVRSYTIYGLIAQDRKRDRLWASANFSDGGDETALIFNRYGVRKAPKALVKENDARVLPPGLDRTAALDLFRALIARAMDSGNGSTLYERINRDMEPSDDEAAATLLGDTQTCRHLQTEGEPPPSK